MPKSVFSDKYNRFRLTLIEARKAAHVSQTEVAKKLRKPQSFVSKYERGERRLDVVEFLEVTRALNLDPCSVLRRLDR